MKLRWTRGVFFLVALSGIVACGPENVTDDPGRFVDRFRQEALLRGVELEREAVVVELVEFEDSEPWARSDTTYKINRKAWVQLNEKERELLVFHGLGHLWLGKSHDDGGIMSDPLIDEKTYGIRREALLDSLFAE